MKVVSYIKESFLEYEDYVSLVLFSYGCNMKCAYCYNYDHITNPNHVISNDAYSIIDSQTTWMTDGLVFLGGEPTIYGTELFDISEYSKAKHGLSVKLFTNGTNPQLIIDGLVGGYFDSVSVDFKSYSASNHILINGKWSQYVNGMLNLISNITERDLQQAFEVRMTVLPDMEESFETIKQICDLSGVRLHRQLDIRDSYKQLGILLSTGH